MSCTLTVRGLPSTEADVVAKLGSEPLVGYENCSVVGLLRELSCTYVNLADAKSHCESGDLMTTYERLDALGVNWTPCERSDCALDTFYSDEK